MKNINSSSFFENEQDQNDQESHFYMQIYLESSKPSIYRFIGVSLISLAGAVWVSALLQNIIPLALTAGVLMGVLYCKLKHCCGL